MGREVGGGSGWGTHVHPWLIHVNVWQKLPQYCKVISLQLKFFLKVEGQQQQLAIIALASMITNNCQEAFNRRLPVCCLGSVRNPLALINF